MDFLKRLFGGGGGRNGKALYLYVQPKMCKEVVEVRIDLYNHLSLRDDNESYYVRKLVSATRCPFQAEVEVYFDKGRNITDKQVTNGAFVTQADYEAFVDSNQQNTPVSS